jgi:hypothetical protein
MEHLSLRELCEGTLEAYKKDTEKGTSFHGGLVGNPGRGLICRGLRCGIRFWDGCLSL